MPEFYHGFLVVDVYRMFWVRLDENSRLVSPSSKHDSCLDKGTGIDDGLDGSRDCFLSRSESDDIVNPSDAVVKKRHISTT
jgi:hypothetical protein